MMKAIEPERVRKGTSGGRSEKQQTTEQKGRGVLTGQGIRRPKEESERWQTRGLKKHQKT